ncbi:MAG: LamB/YcsF family protein [Lysobacter sp.]|nr:LamB/YcsF family protein [Lysobacter sp.]
MPRIDFNCDLGEGCGDDAAIMPWISSANIACGAHAGDDATIRETLRLCHVHGVVVGAHPGYADREHFGRRELALPHAELVALVRDQIALMDRLAREQGLTLRHVKPHGALYNQSAREPDIAAAIAEAVRDHDPSLLLVGMSGTVSIEAAQAAGLRTAHEVFAERGYGPDGRLLPRGTPGAVLASAAATAQALGFALRNAIALHDGRTLRLQADTLCLHGDRADAADFAHALHTALTEAGVRIHSLEPQR